MITPLINYGQLTDSSRTVGGGLNRPFQIQIRTQGRLGHMTFSPYNKSSVERVYKGEYSRVSMILNKVTPTPSTVLTVLLSVSDTNWANQLSVSDRGQLSVQVSVSMERKALDVV
ncbi:hypothetical protein LCGC14_2101220 [marine sediment metagenome]|uniref:Uncharacterized protein n=1 Tax=marine sediment metagenome TaxID=412755 RepID=A0A0F9E9S4_9ZZZZ